MPSEAKVASFNPFYVKRETARRRLPFHVNVMLNLSNIIQTQNRTKTSHPSKYTVSTKMRRKECKQVGSWKSNKRPLGRECMRYHSRLAEPISIQKGEDYPKTTTWIRGKVSFSILRSALLFLGGSTSMYRPGITT